jgi:hypothetical protein
MWRDAACKRSEVPSPITGRPAVTIVADYGLRNTKMDAAKPKRHPFVA